MKKRLIALLLVLVLLLPAAIASAATWYRVTTTSVRVRFLPSESASVLGSYRRDYALTVTSTKDGWSYAIFSNGFEGYVQTKYIAKSKSYSAWVVRDNVSLRSGPSGDFGATAILAKGRRVTVLSHGANYDYVNAGDLGRGYIMNGLLSTKKVAASGNASKSTAPVGVNYDAYVLNSGNRKVNLRSEPSTSAPVIAEYPTGTKVFVISHGPVWDQIQVDGKTGWMMTSFLSTSVPAPTPTPTPTPGGGGSSDTYTAYVVCDNKGTVNVRKGDSTHYAVLFNVRYGAAVTVLKHGNSWDYIEYNGKKGYMMNKYLQLAKPTDAPSNIPDPSVTKTPEPPFEPYVATVYAANGKSVNFHKGPYDWKANVDGVGRLDVGSQVIVLKIQGGWAKVEYNGYTGWVHKEFLK